MTERGGLQKRRTQAERTALSDSRMFEAAIELLCEGGIHRATLRDIGERAGYSRGLASARFGSKEGLFASLVSNIDAKWSRDFAEHVGARTGLEALHATLDAVAHFMEQQPLYTQALYVLWYESLSSHSDVRQRLAEQQERDRKSVERWIAQGQADGTIRADIAAERFAVQFMSFVFGMIYQWHISPGSIDVRQASRDYQQSVRELLAAG
jgi:AcrR family transcriptional regulator